MVRLNSTGTYTEPLEQPITPEEMYTVLPKVGRNKSPGSDGIGIEFYTTNWEIIKEDISEILDQMFLQRIITTQQKQGVRVCLLKSNAALTPEGYQPLTLLNTDYKILARILAHRLRPVLEEHLRTSQFCSVHGNSVIEALSTVRDAVAQAGITVTPLCVLTLDVYEAFDGLSHQYLFTILESYVTCPCFNERIKDLYENATA